jgi:hypothetical protein
MNSPVLKTPRVTGELPPCTRETSLLRRQCLGGIGTIFRAGDGARIISCASSRSAPCARNKVAPFRRRSPIIIRHTTAITTTSSSGPCARSAAIVIKARGPPISEDIARPLAMTDTRSIAGTRLIEAARNLGGEPHERHPTKLDDPEDCAHERRLATKTVEMMPKEREIAALAV